MAKADKPKKPSEEDTAVEAKISDDVVDAEVIEELEDVSVDSESEIEESENPEVAEEGQSNDPETELEASDNDKKADDPIDQSIVPPEATAEPEAVEEPVSTVATKQPAKKTGFVQVALGGAVAAALGFGLSQYVGPLYSAKDETLVQLETAVQAQSDQIEALLSKQAELQTALAATQEASASASSSVEGLTAAVATTNGRIDDAAGALAKLDGRLAAMEKNPITQSLPSAAIEAYEREVEELKAAVASQRAEAASMEQNAKLTAQQALARAALSRVLSALDSGAPYRVALTDLSAATGNAAPAALEAYADEGVTSLANLQDAFPAAAREALAVSRSEETSEGSKLTSFFKAQLGARSVTPQEGGSVDAILSRAEGALRAGRVTDSLAELSTLPDAAQPAFADWLSNAEARQAAFAAGEALSQDLNTN